MPVPIAPTSSLRSSARIAVASLAATAALGLFSGVAAAQYGGNPTPTTLPTDVQSGTVEPEAESPATTVAPTAAPTSGAGGGQAAASRGGQRSTLAFTGADVAGLAAMGGSAVAAGGGLVLGRPPPPALTAGGACVGVVPGRA